ncbi:MAG TPA: hypothetical protein VFV50_14945 [Bdellovibrionales bacterium]|nr:hypothetical protein [Bdellovibrionales bacterium]
MTMKIAVLCLGVTLAAVNLSEAAIASEKNRSRLEDLFVWRVSDTLNLSPETENQFKTEFRRLSEKKAQLNREIETLVEELESTKDAKKIEIQLKEYREKVASQGRILVEEAESFEKLFGKEKFAQYLVLKRELTQKLKDFVSNPPKGEPAAPKKMRDPKIIQDESH